MRKVILFIAMSLDGYIADRNGGVDWLTGEGAETDSMESYDRFVETVDTIVMGHNTYRQIAEELSPKQWPYQGLMTYVITHREAVSTEEIRFVRTPPAELVEALRRGTGKSVWICGGADIVGQLVRKDLIDRYHITVVPTLLGGGIRLFDAEAEAIPLRLVETLSYNGMVDLIYERR